VVKVTAVLGNMAEYYTACVETEQKEYSAYLDL